MVRSTVAHVDLGALQANFRAIREFLASTPADPNGPPRGVPRTIAVVTATAYGHGAALGEAGGLRGAGVRAPILVFGSLSASDLDGLFGCSLTPPISTPSAARAV